MTSLESSLPLAELLSQAPMALTVLDTRGRLLYYSPYAATILDRRPEYLGRDIRSLHQPASSAKITAILEAYANGERREFAWRLKREGREFAVRVAPWLHEGQWAGVLHAVVRL